MEEFTANGNDSEVLKSETESVVRNGYHAQRKIETGVGQMQIKVPGVDDRKLKSKREDRFTRAILPAYMRRTPSIDNLVPALYLSSVSTSAFQTALASILGAGGRYCSN